MAETHDAAAAYVVSKGVIRASNASSDWRNAFVSDILTFMSAVATHSGALMGGYSLSQNGGAMQLLTSSPTNFRINVNFVDTTDGCEIKLLWGSLHSYKLMSNFDLHRRKPIYWVIYKGIVSSHTSGSTTTYGYAPDIMVSLGRDTESGSPNLTGDVASYSGPTDEEWLDIVDNMCLYTPASFMIVNTVNSLTNNQANAGVVSYVVGSIANAITWTTDNTIETGKRMTNGRSNGVGEYHRTASSRGGNGFNSSLLLNGDTPFFPPNSGSQSGHSVIANSVAAINHLTPMWDQASACITANTKQQVWGGLIEPVSTGSSIYHRGPMLINLGSNYYLRCYDMWMPVAAPPESDQEP